MLVALMGQTRVIAAAAEKGPDYVCPGCRQPVILRKGRKVIHHFAHRPPTSCNFASGETHLHLLAKQTFLEFLRNQRGANAEVEYPLAGGRLRADVFVVGRNGRPVAIELQHSSITLDEIERRTSAYMNAGVALLWLPLFRPSRLNWEHRAGGLAVARYSPKPFEKWLHGFNFGCIWYFDPENARLWRGKFEKSMIEVPVSEWYEPGGDHVVVGGYEKISKRWRRLELAGPYPLDAIEYRVEPRSASNKGTHRYPAGRVLKLSVRSDWAGYSKNQP